MSIEAASQVSLGSAVPAPISAAQINRLPYLDVARGILLLVMISWHALGFSNVPPTHFFHSPWWLPGAWATDGFITLSGFTAAIVMPWEKDRRRATGRALVRAWQVFLVMFVSNIFFLVVSRAIRGQADTLREPSWWIGLLTLKTEYSISGILLPIAMLVALTPFLYRVRQRLGLAALSMCCVLLAVFTWGVSTNCGTWLSNHYLFDVLFRRGAGGFPILPHVSFGALGFALGLTWKSGGNGLRRGILISAILAYLLLSWPLPDGLLGRVLATRTTLWPLTHVVIFLLIALLISQVSIASRASAFLAILGKYSLFTFIAHRVFLQGFALCSAAVLHPFSQPLKYIVLFLSTLALMIVACQVRERVPLFERSLKRLYL